MDHLRNAYAKLTSEEFEAVCAESVALQEIERLNTLRDLERVTDDERAQIEAFRTTVKNPDSTKGEILRLLDRAYPREGK